MDYNVSKRGLRFLKSITSPPMAMSGFIMIWILCLAPRQALAEGERWMNWSEEFRNNVWDPWFLFGMGAQAIFFLRFVVQWIVSERRKRSTIPVAFWYLSLAGGLATFVYACHEAQPVFMLGQLLACAIYIRNLMLIYGHQSRKKGDRTMGELETEIGEEGVE